jgi:hypothetical protein
MIAYQILRGKGLLLFFTVFGIWGSYQLFQNKSVGFGAYRITSDFVYHSEWAIEEPQDLTPLKTLLNQKFTFLGVGSQSYAFESADGKYVVKFFIMKHKIPRISDLWHSENVDHRRQNLFSIFKAHKLAYTELKEDTGLLYIHLNKTNHLNTVLQVVDRFGRRHSIDLDKTEFIVQEKAELIFTHLKKLLEQKDKSEAQKCIQATLDLVKRRMDKGISDHDKAVKHNYGFIGAGDRVRAVHLDIGRLEKVTKQKEYNRIKERINTWLQANESSS